MTQPVVQPEWDDERLSALLDGELSQSESAELQARLAENGELRQRLETMRNLREELRQLPSHELPAHSWQGVLARIQQVGLPSRPAPAGTDLPATQPTRARHWVTPTLLVTAAGLCVMAILVWKWKSDVRQLAHAPPRVEPIAPLQKKTHDEPLSELTSRSTEQDKKDNGLDDQMLRSSAADDTLLAHADVPVYRVRLISATQQKLWSEMQGKAQEPMAADLGVILRQPDLATQNLSKENERRSAGVTVVGRSADTGPSSGRGGAQAEPQPPAEVFGIYGSEKDFNDLVTQLEAAGVRLEDAETPERNQAQLMLGEVVERQSQVAPADGAIQPDSSRIRSPNPPRQIAYFGRLGSSSKYEAVRERSDQATRRVFPFPPADSAAGTEETILPSRWRILVIVYE